MFSCCQKTPKSPKSVETSRLINVNDVKSEQRKSEPKSKKNVLLGRLVHPMKEGQNGEPAPFSVRKVVACVPGILQGVKDSVKDTIGNGLEVITDIIDPSLKETTSNLTRSLLDKIENKFEEIIERDVLCETVTDYDGNFSLEIPEESSDLEEIHVKVQRLVDEEGPLAHFKNYVLETVTVKRPFTSERMNIIAKELEYDEQRLTADPSHIPEPKQEGFLKKLATAGWNALYNQFVFEKLKGNETTEEVQAAFPRPEHRLKHDNATLSDMITQWLVPEAYRNGTKENELILDILWDDYGRIENGPLLPNFRVHFDKQKDKMQITSIERQFPGEKWETFESPDEKATQEQKDDYTDVLKLLACGVLTKTEAVPHLGQGHLEVGFIVQALLLLDPKHPLLKLLGPTSARVLPINNLGKSFIFGPTSILSESAIKDMDKLLEHARSHRDFYRQPAKPRFEGDKLAEQNCRFYEDAYKASQEFVKNNWDALKKKENWSQIKHLSDRLVQNSFEYRPYEGEGNLDVWDDTSAFEPKEIMGVKVPPRTKGKDGIVRTFRPITESHEGPADGDMERLILFAANLLFQSAQGHGNAHGKQKEYANDIEFASIAPHDPKMKFMGTTPQAATKHYSIITILNKYDHEEENMYNYEVKEVQGVFRDDKVLEKTGVELKKMGKGTTI